MTLIWIIPAIPILIGFIGLIIDRYKYSRKLKDENKDYYRK